MCIAKVHFLQAVMQMLGHLVKMQLNTATVEGKPSGSER